MAELVCKQCGHVFKPKASDRVTYCSVKCCWEFRRKHSTSTRITYPHTNVYFCKDCGIVGQAKNRRPAGRSRCPKCTMEHARQYYHEHKTMDQGWVKCEYCHKVAWAFKRASKRRFCSERCGKKQLKSDTGSHRKRARKHGVEYESVRLTKLIERDGGRCAVCGKAVKRTNQHTRRRATVGHIVAISKGGSHTWDNVQLECWECNTAHGVKAHGQKRLKLTFG